MGGVILPGAVEQSIKKADAEYLEKHNIKELMQKLMTDIVIGKPTDPIQYITDVLSLDEEFAKQDEFGLSLYRRNKLAAIFKQMDKNDNGTVDFQEVHSHCARYGGNALTEDEIKEIFVDFDTSGDKKISRKEFLQFFARAVYLLDNTQFDAMIAEMLDES
mmetsp:Transcript_25719/g.55862  ORF Transcript_25719/g.55862 Transcript_25719/m.55862 type:complete len:161 (-) Transcript_25719:174-656(-)|eukprot:CAMPEP_0118934786 /NCGR_PEP_ID=MMETSP1169-20130426/14170_1 /TAXON_ID=36882 /ORGANISM="Pyramimonas obovata, Strain CCMP722" /LENGTH=160 /DNA_ID=CAMNT_0006877723 /DNA_START=209 /DNA_END=691 /DNA_ORIENTATION=-